MISIFMVILTVNNNSPSPAFISSLNSLDINQCVHKPTHSFNHTFGLVLTHGIEIEDWTVFPQNPLWSDDFLAILKSSYWGLYQIKVRNKL